MKNYFTHKMRNRSPIEIVGIIIFGAIAISGLAILFGFIIMWLWNWLMPDLFGLATLTYWQAVGIFILLKILLGGCGGSGSRSGKRSHKESCGDKKPGSKGDFSKWKDYDKFWKEEGDDLYKKYVERNTDQAQSRDDDSDADAPKEIE